ncbi:hypothetical protein KC340_g4730 [Hortaea werneckii]|nr:hypothetical protein KC342_g5226 [Hortaea werneckii]KAI7101378.1 hypothetical protein KC339_g6799 [Hortaea werneckii]KAI7241751.1 hypothetical protein KC365_g3453 [Hortaea werneckii]KAI7329260.1 hypothetical protein KC340_g4730 [Hortaea werneckii]KAI7374162.1 hypothetical protein KC328_g16173 [Hortaea werneckii]
MRNLLQLLTVLSALPASLCELVHVISLGKTDFTFDPNSIDAPVGSEVQFRFSSGNFSVASSTYDNPCQPDGRFSSGSIPVTEGMGEHIFAITILDDEPVWFYGAVDGEQACQAGMVGVINPPLSGPQKLGDFKSKAATSGTQSKSESLSQAVASAVRKEFGVLSSSPSPSPVLPEQQPLGGSTGDATTISDEDAKPHGDLKRRRRVKRSPAGEGELLWQASLLTD